MPHPPRHLASASRGPMEVRRRMRWRQEFMAEVSEALNQLGLRACPVCGSAEPLSIGPCPVLMADTGFPPVADALTLGEDRAGVLIFAVRVECPMCGHLMLFNAEKYRADNEKILVAGPPETLAALVGLLVRELPSAPI